MRLLRQRLVAGQASCYLGLKVQRNAPQGGDVDLSFSDVKFAVMHLISEFVARSLKPAIR